jgi:hypothetical protein
MQPHIKTMLDRLLAVSVLLQKAKDKSVKPPPQKPKPTPPKPTSKKGDNRG